MSVETEADEGANACPVCGAGMQVRLLHSKTDPYHELFWAKYGHQCEECGHQGDTWEVLGD